MAVLGPVMLAAFAALGAVINEPNFNVFLVDWSVVGKSVINVSFIAAYISASSYIVKNLLTDKNQNFLGIPTKS